MSKRAIRKEGKIKVLKGDTVPKNLLFLDTETYVMRTDSGGIYFPFRLGYAINLKITKDCQIKKRNTFEAYSIDDMIDFIIQCTNKKETLHVFAHNIPFDIRVMFAVSRLESLGFISEPPIINQMVFIWELKKDDVKIIFYDTANFGVRSVESLGADMGYEKMSINFRTCTDDELMIYCIRDVEILEKFMYQYISFVYRNKLGSFKMTLASQSLAALRTRFMKDDIYIHNHMGALRLERDAYSGGRTEAFQLGYIGQQNYYYMDVNSMYPTAMTKFRLPSRLCGYEHDMSKSDFTKVMYHFYVIADVTLATDNNAYALKLSSRESDYNYLRNPKNMYYPDNSTRRLIFPIGKFRTTLHHEELRLALKEKSIIKIHRVAWYERSNPFDEYIDFFYQAKAKYGKEGNKTWRMIAKLFLNSLYGKFGQLAPHREELPASMGYSYHRFPLYMEKVDLFGQIVSWQGRTFLEYKQGETAFSVPAIAGAITANARMILHNYIQEAGKGNVFYVDTDSLIVNEQGYHNLGAYEDENELGYLGLERVGRRLIIRNCKDYRLDSASRFKGLPKSAVKISSNLWRYDKFQGFITWINNQALDGAIGKTMTKSRKSEYNKGIVLPDNLIIPFVLSE